LAEMRYSVVRTSGIVMAIVSEKKHNHRNNYGDMTLEMEKELDFVNKIILLRIV